LKLLHETQKKTLEFYIKRVGEGKK